MIVGVRGPGLAGHAVALVRACHPLPAAGVTAFTTALAAAAGNSAGTCVLVAAAVLTGQLTIGWSNDRLDWRADQQVGRREKPVATGEIPVAVVDAAIVLAAAACVPLSLELGWRAGLVHLAAVACGWLYNAWLKGTWLSWLPYAAAFAALPAVATLALPEHPAPAGWALLGGGLLGIAANLTNAVPDLERDRQTGFHGFPSRIGAHASLVVALILLVVASGCIAFGPPGAPGVAAWTGLAITCAAAAAAAPSLWRWATSRVPFYTLLGLVPVDLVMIIIAGNRLH